MCGIIGLLLADERSFVNQMLFDGLTVLQHRGQDAAGMVTAERYYSGGSGTEGSERNNTNTSSSNNTASLSRLHLRKDNGLVKDVFQTHHMVELRGNVGLGHVRYPTAGTSSCAEAQPLYTNYPYGICVAHNGNLTNTDHLSRLVRDKYQRHINTDSDSELLLNMFAQSMADRSRKAKSESSGSGSGDSFDMVSLVFASIEDVLTQCQGGYAGIYLINGVGLVGFRDPHGIRPLVMGTRTSTSTCTNAGDAGGTGGTTAHTPTDYVIASESVAIDTLGFDLVRDVRPGEAIFLDMKTGLSHSKTCHPAPALSPCIFEYVYFARPDSIMDGVSVYESRLKMGEKLAEKIMRVHPDHDVDVVIPIPDTSRTSALQAAYILGRPFREGFIKNRYIARTFIMPGQESRKKSVRLKLNTIKSEFAGRNVLLVDDSIVRGTTAREIVQMARDAGARKVYFTSAAPPIRYPNIYGIDIPTRNELVAYERDEADVADHIGCEWVVYQDLSDLEESVRCLAVPDDDEEGEEDGKEDGKKEGESERKSPTTVKEFDTSCFSGRYVTGEKITDPYFTRLHALRNDAAQESMRRSVSGTITGGGKGGRNANAAAKEGGDGGGEASGMGGGGRDPAPTPNGSFHAGISSHDGCESVSNDKRDGEERTGGGCEGIVNA